MQRNDEKTRREERERNERLILQSQVTELRSTLNALEEENNALFEISNKIDGELRRARVKPFYLLFELLKHKTLKALSAAAFLPSRMKQRFFKSAKKRDPKRSTFKIECENNGVRYRNNLDPESLKKAFRGRLQDELDRFLDSTRRIPFLKVEKPEVTIILILWNQAELTLGCLQSLINKADVTYDVVIVNNDSSDRTNELLERVENATIIQQDKNVGFLKAVNIGLQAARGGHILLLNNDALIRAGTLTSAVSTLEAEDDIGAVGGPIILPNGRLQEAGSIIWRDGSCQGYGRDDDPEKGEYKFKREVDFCSGAFLMVKEGIFQKIGGFDEDYMPAYYEETDLCVRIRDLGLRVLYDPRAAIDHFEFGSSEKKSSAIELQKRNRKRFVEKHPESLLKQYEPKRENLLQARARDQRPRLLYIEDAVPIKSLGSGFPRANEILSTMVEAGFFVTLYPTNRMIISWNDVWNHLPVGVEIINSDGLANLGRFLEERIDYYDQIFVSRPHNMVTIRALSGRKPELFNDLRIIYDAEALFSLRDLKKAQLLGDLKLERDAKAAVSQEVALAQASDHIIAVTPSEAKQFHTSNKSVVSVLGHSIVPDPTQSPYSARNSVLFVGNLEADASPNVDSLEWFIDNVVPLLSVRLPEELDFVAAGRLGATSLHTRSNVEVTFVGEVPNLTPLFEEARVFIAPTRFAAGIPHKVHEAAAKGVPVVATSLLAEQLGWSNDRELLVADTPEDFADAIARLYLDQETWSAVRHNALMRVKKDCDPASFKRVLTMVLREEFEE